MFTLMSLDHLDREQWAIGRTLSVIQGSTLQIVNNYWVRDKATPAPERFSVITFDLERQLQFSVEGLTSTCLQRTVLQIVSVLFFHYVRNSTQCTRRRTRAAWALTHNVTDMRNVKGWLCLSKRVFFYFFFSSGILAFNWCDSGSCDRKCGQTCGNVQNWTRAPPARGLQPRHVRLATNWAKGTSATGYFKAVQSILWLPWNSKTYYYNVVVANLFDVDYHVWEKHYH